nr:uncharacterized protein CI109_000055 [Kwoniella shandongensis]KAA5531217.1 hypothetical protein CI109_000055 [Kwoniella shandongensis]
MSLNITIGDTSSLIMYSRGGIGWEALQNASDSSLYGGTYHKTNDTGATVSLDFSGSAITIYGRSNRGYFAAIDTNITAPYVTGSNVLFHRDDLSMGFHTVTISNFANFQGPDLDFELNRFVVGATDGSDSDTLTQTIVESDHPAVRGFGNVTSLDGGRNGTSLYANGPGAGISLNFTGLDKPRLIFCETLLQLGASIEIYSPPWNPTLPVSSQYAVYLNSSSIPPSKDDKPFASYPGGTNGHGKLAFFANGLPQGQHRVLIVNENDGAFGFDYAEVSKPDRYAEYEWMCWSNCSTTGVNSIRQQGPGYSQPQPTASTLKSGTGRMMDRKTGGLGFSVTVIGLLMGGLMMASVIW